MNDVLTPAFEPDRQHVVDDDDLFVLVDGHHRVTRVSDRMYELTRLRPGDLVGLDHVVLLDPAEGETFASAYLRVRAQAGAVEQATVRLADRSGLRRTFDLSITNRLDDPSVAAIAVTGVDVTHVRASQVVARLRNRLLDLLPTVVTVVDDVGTIVYCSPRSETLLGWTPAEVVGRAMSEANLLPIEPEHVEAIRLAAETSGHWVGDIELRRKDGSIVPVQLVLERIDDDEVGFHGTVGISFDITERRKLEDHLDFQATHDALTGLFNRQRFVELLEDALTSADEDGRRVAVLFIDLDDFKSVNDRIGHAAGDALLAAVGAQLRSALGSECVAARFGGDEFVVYCPDIDGVDGGVEFTQHLLDALGQPIGMGTETAVISASAGIALSSPGVMAEELLRRSDHAMYGAKDGGKNRIEVFDDDDSHRKRRRRELADELARALDHDELTVHFQPEVSLRDRVTFFEALVRWDDPQRGTISPQEFVSIAEASGLIHRLGRMVLDESCRAMRTWIDLGLADGLTVAVNVSARQLLDRDFPDVVEQLAARWRVPPEQICLEVTESALVDGDIASLALRRLDAIGVTIAIDDFGTGYSSLGRISQFPLDFMKVDRSFVAGLATDPVSASIVQMVVNLAHDLGLQATAEGIETSEQLDRLTAAGCDIGQGFLWSPAVPFDEATAMLVDQPFTDMLPRRARATYRGVPLAIEHQSRPSARTVERPHRVRR